MIKLNFNISEILSVDVKIKNYVKKSSYSDLRYYLNYIINFKNNNIFTVPVSIGYMLNGEYILKFCKIINVQLHEYFDLEYTVNYRKNIKTLKFVFPESIMFTDEIDFIIPKKENTNIIHCHYSLESNENGDSILYRINEQNDLIEI